MIERDGIPWENQTDLLIIENCKDFLLLMSPVSPMVNEYSEPKRMLVILAQAYGRKNNAPGVVERVMNSYSERDQYLIKLLSKRTRQVKTMPEVEFDAFVADITLKLLNPTAECKFR
jgi:hypothetical protein